MIVGEEVAWGFEGSYDEKFGSDNNELILWQGILLKPYSKVEQKQIEETYKSILYGNK